MSKNCKCQSQAKKPKYRVLICAAIHNNIPTAIRTLNARNPYAVVDYMRCRHAMVARKAAQNGNLEFIKWLLDEYGTVITRWMWITVRNIALFAEYSEIASLIEEVIHLDKKVIIRISRKISMPVDIAGLSVIRDFVNDQEAECLLNSIDSRPWEEKPWSSRRVQHYGAPIPSDDPLVNGRRPRSLPGYLESVLKKLHLQTGVHFDQLTVNDYPRGAYMPTHIDSHRDFGECIAIISLNSGVGIQMRCQGKTSSQVWLPQNSLMLIKGEARYLWEHGILQRRYDRVNDDRVKRHRRTSLAFRTARNAGPCQCAWPSACVDQGSNYRTLPSRLGDAVPMHRRPQSQQIPVSLPSYGAYVEGVDYVIQRSQPDPNHNRLQCNRWTRVNSQLYPCSKIPCSIAGGGPAPAGLSSYQY